MTRRKLIEEPNKVCNKNAIVSSFLSTQAQQCFMSLHHCKYSLLDCICNGICKQGCVECPRPPRSIYLNQKPIRIILPSISSSIQFNFHQYPHLDWIECSAFSGVASWLNWVQHLLVIGRSYPQLHYQLIMYIVFICLTFLHCVFLMSLQMRMYKGRLQTNKRPF